MMRIYDILISQILVGMAGMFYSIVFKDLNILTFFAVEMLLSGLLIMRVERYKKEKL
jgi:hypothetical protein